MRILYSAIQSTSLFQRYLDKEPDILRKHGDKKVENIFDDDSVDNALIRLYIFEMEREKKREKVDLLCSVLDSFLLMVVTFFYTRWLLENLPLGIAIGALLLSFVTFFIISSTHTKDTNNELPSYTFSRMLSLNDSQQHSMQTWEQRKQFYDHEYDDDDHYEDEDDEEETDSILVRDEGVLAQASFKMKEWIQSMFNKKKGV